MTARTDAAQEHERIPATALELDLDYCDNDYGIAPCTAGRVETGTAQAGAGSTLTLRAAASAVDDAFNGMTLSLHTGAGAVQNRRITDYVGATKVATVDRRWSTNMLQFTAAYDNAYWSKTAVLTDNGDGWWNLNDDNAAAWETLSRTVAVSTTTNYILSAKIKKMSGYTEALLLRLSFSGGVAVLYGVVLDPNTGNVVQKDSGAGTVGVVDGGDHWRFWVSGNSNNNTSVGVQLYSAVEPLPLTGGYDSSRTGAIDFKDLQLEAASDLSDYIEAGAAAVTLPGATTEYHVIDRANACYNVFMGETPCKDKDNFVKGVKTVKFIGRGSPIPPGEQVRPYLLKQSYTPTEIDPVKCLAARSQVTFTLTDEPCRDDLDKYVDQRSTEAGGTFWTRLQARNPNAIGRFARARRGYVVTPWDWDTFQTELYVIEVMKGPAKDGTVQVTLSDAVKLLDRVMLPVATDGKLTAELHDVVNTGFMQSGSTSTSAVLAAAASAVDDEYNGMEVLIIGGTGLGQRRVISDYTGTTRTAVVSAWDVTPDTTSIYEIGQLSIDVGSGKGALYADPVVTGRAEFVCIGDEVIRYTAITGDVLSWPDTSYREQFGTERDDHDVDAGVQQCLAYVDDPATYAVNDIINRGGITDDYIDTAKLASLEAQWYGQKAHITACITHPEKGNVLLADLLVDLNMMSWWHPIEQVVQFETNAPVLGSTDTWTDDDAIRGTVDVEKLDKDRLTRTAAYFGLRSATADEKKATSYGTVQVYIDSEAEGDNGYNDVRADVRHSRWMVDGNAVFTLGTIARRLRARVNAPTKLKLALDPRVEPVLGALVDINTRKVLAANGQNATVRYRIVRVVDDGAQYSVEARSTSFGARYAFIAPNGYPDFASASSAQRERAFIADNGGAMSDGSSPYLII